MAGNPDKSIGNGAGRVLQRGQAVELAEYREEMFIRCTQ